MKYVQKMKRMQLQLVMKVNEAEKAQKKENDAISAYVDANWANDKQKRSTSGSLVWYRGCVINCWSQAQPVIALSILIVLAELSRRATIRIAFQHIALPRRLMDVVELLEGKRWIDEDNRRVESDMDQNDDVGPIRYHRIRKRRSI